MGLENAKASSVSVRMREREREREREKMERMFVSLDGPSAQSLHSKYPFLGNSEKFDSRNSLEVVRAPGRVPKTTLSLMTYARVAY